jgi:ribosome-binding factor A
VLGGDAERRRTLEALQNAHGYLQRRVAGELRLKHTPTLAFEYDSSLERSLRISELLEGQDAP